MPKPFKLHSTRPLPPDAEIVTRDGKPHARLKERGRAVLYPLTKDGASILKPSKCWYFKFRDGTGTVRRKRGFADLRATEQLAAETERRVSRLRAGLTDPAEEHARRPLTEHLNDYGRSLEAKGVTAKHNRETLARISALLAGCGFVFSTDLDAGRVSAWLGDLRRPGQLVELPPGDAFGSSAVAKLFGMTVDAVRRLVARHRLPTVGSGRNRKLTRAAVQAIADQQTKGASPRTVNSYTVAIRGFTRWLVRLKRIGSDPLESLPLLSTATDTRRARRELTAEELRALLVGTRASDRTFRGLTGEDRFTLYLLASATGFRSNALANLTPADFDLTANTPVATLPARLNKSRKTKIQPIPSDVATTLREYLTGKPASSPIWGGTWATGRAGAQMLRRDLEAVDIPYSVEGPDGPEYADFHALRHTYLTMLGRNGVDLRTAQELAGHSTPLLTAKYTHRRLYDLAGAVDKLPTLVPPTGESDAGELPLRKTGTEGAKADKPVRLGVPPGVPAGYADLHSAAPMYTFGIVGGTSDDLPQPLEMQQPGASQHRVASRCTQVGDLGFEPRLTESESVVLPLHQSPNSPNRLRLTPQL